MNAIDISPAILLGALIDAPVWALAAMGIIIIVLIVMLYKELWSFFTKLEVGVVLLILVTILSIVGGLLPQHLTKADAAEEIIGLTLPDAIEPEKAAELTGLPSPAEIHPSMAARMLDLPDPANISDQEAVALMGLESTANINIDQTYQNWLKREYIVALLAKYDAWFKEKAAALPGTTRFFFNIGFFYVYHTWYYLLLAYLLFISVICCSIRRLQGFVKMRRREPAAYGADRLMRQAEVVEFDLGPGESIDREKAAAALAGSGFTPRACKPDDVGYQFQLNFGFKIPTTTLSAIFHFSLVLALIGFITTGCHSWRSEITLAPGETQEIKLVSPDMKMYKWYESLYEKRGWEWAKPSNKYNLDASFVIGCNDYFSEYFMGEEGWYTLKDYKSDLYIMDNGKEMERKVIEVNFPLTYKGIDFFQQNVEKTGVLEITPPGGEPVEVSATIWGTKIPPMEGMPAMLTASSLVWGKLLNDDGTTSDIGPTVRVGKRIPKEKKEWPNPGKEQPDKGAGIGMMGMGTTETDWLFEVKDGEVKDWEGWTFALKGPYRKATGLEVVNDPGVPILWVAIVIMIITLILRSYMPSYSARVDFAPSSDGGGHLIVAGNASGLGANFKKQAERIRDVLKG